jgi:hypothetical protein
MDLENGSHLTQSTLKSMSGFVTFLIARSLSPTAQATMDGASPLTPGEKAPVEGHQTLRLMEKLVAVRKEGK